MNKILLLIVFSAIGITHSNAQTKLGYYREAQAGFIYTSYKTSGEDITSSKLSGISLDLRINYSLLGKLIFRDPEKKFFIGDHIGVGFGIGYFKKPDDVPFMIPFNLEYGLKTTYIINDDLEVGVKYIAGALNYFTDLKNDFSLNQKPSIIPAVRFKQYMGSVGFGSATTGQSGAGKGSYIMMEGRRIFGEMDDDQKGFLFLRFENYSGEYDESTLKDNGTQISVGFGFM